MTNDLKVTSAKEWRRLREEGAIVQLPTGVSARLRPVSLSELARKGRIPNTLLSVVSETITRVDGPQKGNARSNLEKIEATDELNKIIIESVFLDPKIVDDPKEDNEISYYDVSEIDKEFVLTWAQAPSREVRGFRYE